ncbi:MAG: BACON domain-containing carbohydrate-binding protein, partial [Bryobacteraceae bacterium]
MRLLAVLSLSVLFCVSVAAQNYTIHTFAGGGLPNNVSATSVRLPEIGGVAVDSAGNTYLSVPAWSVIYQLNASTKNLVLFAGTGTAGYSSDPLPAASAQLRWPYGLAVDASNNLYIADTGNNVIRMISNGKITTIAGTGPSAVASPTAVAGPTYTGPATSAQLNQPYGVAVDASGNVYIADTGNSVVREVTSGNISTFAGDGTAGYAGDGAAATAAELNLPRGVAVDSSGNVYIADTGNNVVRGITVSNGNITTIAGDGTPGYSGDGAAATSAELSQPYGVAVDASGNVYIADSNNNVVREVAASNAFISTFAGDNKAGFSGDGAAATSAELNEPNAVALDASGNLYIVDSGNGRIRKVSSATILTIAGGGLGNFGDGGAATSAGLSSPQSVALDAAGSVYIADTLNHVIRKVSNGVITTVAGNGTPGYTGDGAAAISAQLHWPYGVAVDASGNLYIADTGNNVIREVSNGTISTIAGNFTAGAGYSGDGGAATSAELRQPNGVAVDASGNVYIADTGNNVIRKVSGGTISTLAGNGYGAGTIYCSYSGDGNAATSAELCEPTSVAVDASGNVYIADTGNNVIREVSGVNIWTIAGGGTYAAPLYSGAATSAKLNGPRGVALDPAGNLYIADTENNLIRMVSNGVIASIAGNGTAGYSGDNDPATSAELAWPYSVAVSAGGTVYIADTLNDVIRSLTNSLSAQGASLTAVGGGGTIPVNAGAGVAWTASSNDSWITITSGASGTGSGSVSFSLDANGGAARTGTITIAGQTFTITQAGTTSGLSAVGSMAQIASAGGWETSLTLVNLGTAQGEAQLNFYANDGTTPLLPFTIPQQSGLDIILGSTF